MSKHGPLALPLHPTLTHPRTGAPLQAIYVRRDGRVMWPIIGASPDDGAAGGDAGDGGDGASGADGAAGGDAGAGAGAGGKPADDTARDLGFPRDTPVAEMTDTQRAAYWQHKAQKHESRYKQLVGNRRFEEAQEALTEYERIKREQMTPAEQALAAAREEGKQEARTQERRSSARAIFRGALDAAGITGADQEEIVTNFNVDGFITDDGVDTTKITNFAKRFSTSGTDNGGRQRRDFGGGNRGGGQQGSDRGSRGKSEAQRRFGKQKTETGS